MQVHEGLSLGDKATERKKKKKQLGHGSALCFALKTDSPEKNNDARRGRVFLYFFCFCFFFFFEGKEHPKFSPSVWESKNVWCPWESQFPAISEKKTEEKGRAGKWKVDFPRGSLNAFVISLFHFFFFQIFSKNNCSPPLTPWSFDKGIIPNKSIVSSIIWDVTL